jgi:plastocyanin
LKLDVTKLPISEAVIGSLIGVVVVTFVLAFSSTGDGSGGEAASGSPDVETPTEGPDSTPPPDGPDGPISVVLQDNSFDPEELTVQAGSSATFELTNEGNAIHNMHIAGPEGDYTEDFCAGDGDPCSDPNRIASGDTGTLTWQVPDAPGEVEFRCDFHAQDMTGTITIE